MREMIDIDALAERLPLSKHQLYKLTKHGEYPLPHKKIGKKLLFDMSAIWRWFDSLPGRDETLDF